MISISNILEFYGLGEERGHSFLFPCLRCLLIAMFLKIICLGVDICNLKKKNSSTRTKHFVNLGEIIDMGKLQKKKKKKFKNFQKES